MSIANGHRRPVRATPLGPPDPDRLRETLAARTRRVREWYGPEDWFQFGYPADFFEMGGPLGFGGGGGFPQDRTTDQGLAPGGTVSEEDWRRAMTLSRWVVEHNQLALGFHGHITNFIYGSGATWRCVLRGESPGSVQTGTADVDGDGVPDADPAVVRCQTYLEEWRRASGWGECSASITTADLDGADPIAPADLHFEAGRRALRDGEVMVRFWLPRGDEFPAIRFVEPEYVRTPTGQSPSLDYAGSAVLDWDRGVCTPKDDPSRRIAYWVCNPDNPHEGEAVPAGRIAAWRLNVDATVRRGWSDFAPVREELESCRKLLRNMGETARILSAIAYLRQHAPTTTESQISTLVAAQRDYSAPRPTPERPGGTRSVGFVEPGAILDVSNGMQHVPPPIAAGAQQFIEIEQAILRGVGLRWGCPEYFTGDSSNANFASTAISGGPFDRATRRRQKDATAFEQSVAARVLAFGVRAGRLTAEDVSKVHVLVTFPEPAVMAESDRAQLANTKKQLGFSPQTLITQLGGDPKQEAANNKAWQPDQGGPGGGPPNPVGGDPFGEGDDPFNLGPATEGRDHDCGCGGRAKGRRREARRLVRLLMEEKATGEFKDHAGHRYCLDQGKRVKCPDETTGDKVRRIKGQVSDEVETRLASLERSGFAGRMSAWTARRLGRAVRMTHHVLMLGMHKSQQIADEAAARRGLSDEGRKALRVTLGVLDFVGGWPVGALAGTAAGAMAGPIAGAAALKVGSFLPSASIAYIAYSAARDPVATWAAARAVLSGQAGRTHEATDAATADRLATIFHGRSGADLDWAHAVVLAALGHGQSLADVEQALDEYPNPPQPDDIHHVNVAGALGFDPADRSAYPDFTTRESVARESGPPGPPPRPGLVWNDGTKRWRNPETGEEHDHSSAYSSSPSPKVFHHEATHDEIKRRAKSLWNLVKANRHELLDDHAFDEKVDNWQVAASNYLHNRYAAVWRDVSAKLNADFGPAIQAIRDQDGTLPGWAEFHTAVKAARDAGVASVSTLADYARDAAKPDATSADKDWFGKQLDDIRDELNQAHDPVYAALKVVRDHLAGDRKGEFKLSRYLESSQPVVLAEGYTGRITDKLGRARCYDDGKPVPCHQARDTQHRKRVRDWLAKGPGMLTPGHLRALHEHLVGMTVPELKAVQKQFLGAHAGKLKGARVNALLAWAKTAPTKPVPTPTATPPFTAADRAAAHAHATEHYGQWAAGLNDPHRQAIAEYAGENAYKAINNDLREGRLPTGYENTVRLLDEAIFSAPGLPGATVLYRGVGPQRAKSLVPGAVVEEPAYLSTTLVESTAGNFNTEALVRIVAPKGAQAVAMDATGAALYQGEESESEYLFGRGTRLRVLSREKHPDGYDLIHAEMLP